MNDVILFRFARATECDHGRKLIVDCARCDQLRIWIAVRFALLLSIALWGLIGMIAIWWLK